jgi:hypothetical protein
MAAGNPGLGFIQPHTTGWGIPGVTASSATIHREDLADVMTIIDPDDAPFFTMVQKGPPPRAIVFDWVEDVLPSISTAGVAPGAEFSVDTATTPLRKTQANQIFRRDVAVADTESALDPAGVGDALRYQTMNAARALGRAIEQRCFDASTAKGSGTASGGFLMASLLSTISKHAYSADATAVGGAGGATGVNLTEVVMNNVIGNAWTDGGSPLDVFLNKAAMEDINGFSSGASSTNQRVVAAYDQTVHRMVRTFVSSYGTLRFHLDRWVPQGTGTTATADTEASGHFVALDMRLIRWRWLRPVKTVPLGKSGDNTKYMVVGEGAVECKGEYTLSPTKAAHARIYAILPK